jgi:hypothetical protein
VANGNVRDQLDVPTIVTDNPIFILKEKALVASEAGVQHQTHVA